MQTAIETDWVQTVIHQTRIAVLNQTEYTILRKLEDEARIAHLLTKIKG
jgi:hypothetical protein